MISLNLSFFFLFLKAAQIIFLFFLSKGEVIFFIFLVFQSEARIRIFGFFELTLLHPSPVSHLTGKGLFNL